jgi:cytosine/adenosine deaminase-related metal-dependent hydrolase
MKQAFLHRAAWMAPITGQPVENGAVLVRNGVILAAGPYERVKAESPPLTTVVDHGYAILMPALVNAHTHLELTGLAGRIHLPRESFRSWLEELLPLRPTLTPEVQSRGVVDGRALLASSGAALCGDIANGLYFEESHEEDPPERFVLHELLGFDRDSLGDALGPDGLEAFLAAARSNPSLSLAAHACYSVSAGILRGAKEWCRAGKRVFSIHVAEHADEIEFLQSGNGFCRELLESLGRWVPGWAPPRATPAAYLEGLGVLDRRTLLVHAAHMSRSDWEIVVRNGCSVCFCPRSNANLGVGRPHMELALELGVTAALGTDSLASNSDLDLFAEASYVIDNFSGIPPKQVLSMITLGGAWALGKQQSFGSIEKGKSASLLAVTLPERFNANELSEIIVNQGKKGEWQWADRCRSV